jgi:Protein of unknown function (DUF3179)
MKEGIEGWLECLIIDNSQPPPFVRTMKTRGVPLSLYSILCLVCLTSTTVPGQDYKTIEGLMSQDEKVRQSTAEKIIRSRNLSLVPGMVDALFYTPKNSRKELVEVLQKFTGESVGEGYYEWVELIGRRTDLKPGPEYLEWKVSLLSRIDPAYKKILYPNVPSDIRFEEIVWGGVKLDGIPSLDNPPKISAAEATLSEDEKVFGLSIGSESRAYPLRYLSWHEMANDILGGQPIMLSY